MKTNKILDAEISNMLISSLPSRPTAPSAFGGRGFGAVEMKAAFDKLPLFLVSKINSLLEDIASGGEDSVLGTIPTGISEGHTLFNLLSDIKNGNLSGYLDVLGESLTNRIAQITEELSRLSDHAASTPDHSVFITGEQLENSLAEYFTSIETTGKLNTLKREIESFVALNLGNRVNYEELFEILEEYITGNKLLLHLQSYVTEEAALSIIENALSSYVTESRLVKELSGVATKDYVDGILNDLANALDKLNNGGASNE